MVLKLYGSPLSTCTQSVMTVLHEKQVPYEVTIVDLRTGAQKSIESSASTHIMCILLLDISSFLFENHLIEFDLTENKDPEYMEKQPFGQIPYIDDDGFILYESRAICRYIAIKYANQGTPLIPPHTDLKATALFEQAASVEQANFDAFAGKLVAEKVFKPWRGATTNEEVAAYLKAELAKRLDVYDQILSSQEYVAGPEITLADIFHIPYGSLLELAGAGELIPERPHVKAWWDRITGRESWLKLKSAN